MLQQDLHAFTTVYDCPSPKLMNEVTIHYEGTELLVKALWDTGATCTCVSHKVVSSLNLVAVAKQSIVTPSCNGKETDVYMVDIILPNAVKVQNVNVCDSEIGCQGFDVLIGMNIIGLGDFAISNFDKKTTFSFRMPSKQKTDYVAQINAENLAGKHGKGNHKHK